MCIKRCYLKTGPLPIAALIICHTTVHHKTKTNSNNKISRIIKKVELLIVFINTKSSTLEHKMHSPLPSLLIPTYHLSYLFIIPTFDPLYPGNMIM